MNNLEKLTVKELREICKEYNVKGYYKMKKDEIITELKIEMHNAKLRKERFNKMEKERAEEARAEKELVEQKQTAKEIDMNELTMEQLVAEATEACLEPPYLKGGDNVTDQEIKKESYKETMTEGSIVAVRLKDGKVISAMVKKNNASQKKVKVETKLGTVFSINYRDVLWVKTTLRFPSYIYNQLKGFNADGTEKK